MDVFYKAEDLVLEIKNLKASIKEIAENLISAKCSLQTKESQIMLLQSDNDELKKTINELQIERTQLIKRSQAQIKKLEANIKRNDIFSNRKKEYSMSKKEKVMLQDMNDIRRVNKILLDFIDCLGTKYGFDPKTLATLGKIAEGSDDVLIKLFFKGIDSYKKIESNDIPSSKIDVADTIGSK